MKTEWPLLPTPKVDILLAILAAWLTSIHPALAQTFVLNADPSLSATTTDTTSDYGWSDGAAHQVTLNNGAVWYLGNGSAAAGRLFIGVNGGSSAGNGSLTITSTSGAPGTVVMNGYNSADPCLGSLGHVSGGNYTGTLTISGGVRVVMGGLPLKYQGGVNTITIGNGLLDYATNSSFKFKYYASVAASVRHIVGANGSLIVKALIADAAGFSAWAAGAGINVGASDITIQAASGSVLVFTRDTTAGTTTITAGPPLPSPPSIVTGPQSTTYLLGDYLSPLVVTASGSQPFSYQWMKNGFIIPNATSSSYSLATPLTPGNAGSYSVAVSNSLGSVTSAPATITVLDLTTVPGQAAAIVGRYQTAFAKQPAQTPSNGAVDGPLMGNGNMLAVMGGQAGDLQFYINRNDQWVMVANGGVAGPRPLSRLDVSLPGLQGGTYHVQQDLLHGLTNGQFTNGSATLNVQTAVSATSDLLWVLLSTTSGSISGQAILNLGGSNASAGRTASDLQLGREQYGGGRWYLAGKLDEARVYSRALSASEVATLSGGQNVAGNLIRWYTFDNISGGTVPDASGSGANGTLSGSAAVTGGDIGSAVNLDGATGYVDTPACPALTTGTVSAFIYIPNLSASGGVQYIFSNGEWNAGWSLGLVNGCLRMAVGSDYAVSTSSITANQWVHVAGTFDGRVVRAYINGVQVAANGIANTTGVSGSTQYVERDFFTGVSIPDAAASALSVVGGTTNGAFVVTPGNPVLLAVSSQSLMVRSDFLNDAIASASNFQMADLASLQASDEAWWGNFWGKSFVEIPDQTLMQRYYLSHYVMACASRNPDFPPGLQGWVTTDSPNWQGDFHLNYNYEAPFYGLYAANHIEQADPYNQPLFDIAPAGQQFASSQLGISGIYLPVGICPKGNFTLTATWGQKSDASYACLPLLQRWYVTRNLNYGAQAYPFIKGVAQFWQNYLVFQGGRYVDLNDQVQEAWPSNTGTDTNPIIAIAFIRQVLNCAIEMSTALGVDASSRPAWQNILAGLSTYTVCTASQLSTWPQGLPQTIASSDLLVWREAEVGTSWLNGNSLPIQNIYPGNDIGLDSPANILQIAANQINAVDNWIDNNGMSSFYPAAARIGYDPGTILSHLDDMLAYWGWSNGFYGASGGYMENESIVPNTIQEMLMQSYEGIIRFFPCWQIGANARFANLRAYGAFLVSAEQGNGVVGGVSITSEQGYPCTVESPWTGQSVAVTRNGFLGEVVSGATFTLPTAVNETLTLRPATGYDVWAQGIGNIAERSPDADAAGDGNTNLVNYATGGSPIGPNSSSPLNVSIANGTVSLGFTRNIYSTDATIIVEAATTLTDNTPWVAVATNQNGVWSGTLPIQETGTGNSVTVTIQETPAAPAKFYRLIVTKP